MAAFGATFRKNWATFIQTSGHTVSEFVLPKINPSSIWDENECRLVCSEQLRVRTVYFKIMLCTSSRSGLKYDRFTWKMNTNFLPQKNSTSTFNIIYKSGYFGQTLIHEQAGLNLDF